MRGKRQREDTYSVRLPAGFPHVASSVVREMLAVLFAQKVPLVGDPGSGEVYLKLTLPCPQVHALQALAGGDAAGVALRRLVATFAGSSLPVQRPVRALPPPMLPSPENGQIVASGTPRMRPLSEPPPWYGLGAEQWAREGREAKEYVLKMQSLAAAPAVVKAKAPLPSSSWAIFFRLFILYFIVPMGLIFLFGSISGSGDGARGGPSAPASPYPQWRPK
jgi:hypothetical protein